jgi:uncharacterized protein YegP (UPF0339 family)
MHTAPWAKTAAKNGVESVKKNAAGATVADLTE